MITGFHHLRMLARSLILPTHTHPTHTHTHTSTHPHPPTHTHTHKVFSFLGSIFRVVLAIYMIIYIVKGWNREVVRYTTLREEEEI